MRFLTLRLLALLSEAVRDLAPLLVVIGFFQLVVLRQPLPDLGGLLIGVAAVAVGLALFVHGLEQGLFPLGENMAGAFARKGSLTALVTFAFALGFGTTIAEPALIAVASEGACAAAAAEFIAADPPAIARYALHLRLTVAVAVGIALVVGVIRILKGWPIHVLIIGGYVLVGVLTLFSPDEIVALAYDTGGVTTSTITVPLVTALGVGLATVIRGRNPITDGFGLIAFASLTPMMLVLLVFGVLAGGR
jgi:Flp pilus assembly secretin CpaC